MDYPFVKCLHPRRVYNKYTKQSLIVGCGKCSACINSKSSSMTIQTSLESQLHRFTYFVTLTYAPEHLPTFSVDYDEDNRGYRYINYCERLSCLYDDDVMFINCGLNYSSSKLSELQDKCELGGLFSYVCKRDVQLFMKRLRKHLVLNNAKEKIRYYLCAEYGPRTFRAHYHLLLWFDECSTLNVMPRCICKAWTFGRVDYSLSRGGCAGYCASYVNSVSHLPEIFKTSETKPFSTHSVGLAQEMGETEYERVYECSARDIIEKSVVLNGSMLPLHLSRTFKNRYFPRCRDFSNQSSGELYRTYTFYDAAKYYYGTEDVGELVSEIYCDDSTPFDWLFTPYCTPQRVFRDLSFSKRFLRRNCSGYSPRFVLNRIVEFYKELDYENLRKQYDSQSRLIDIDINNLSLVDCFYDNTFNFDVLKGSDIYSSFYSDSCHNFDLRVKHKCLNDANRIFLTS